MDFLLNKNGEPSLIRIGLFFLAVILACTAVSVGIDAAFWGGKVILAPFIGQGDTVIRVESSDNRVTAQKKFEMLYSSIQTYQKQIDNAQKDIVEYDTDNAGKADPSGAIAAEKGRLRQIRTGLQNSCLDAVRTYNAAARSITEAKFRQADLPESISTQSCDGVSK